MGYPNLITLSADSDGRILIQWASSLGQPQQPTVTVELGYCTEVAGTAESFCSLARLRSRLLRQDRFYFLPITVLYFRPFIEGIVIFRHYLPLAESEMILSSIASSAHRRWIGGAVGLVNNAG